MQVTRDRVPLLSIIVPVHQMAGKLGILTGWMDIALNQGIEVIIVHDYADSGTGDELKILVEKYASKGILFLEGRYQGPGRARNAGKRIATGKFLNFTDSDDLPNPLEMIRMCEELNVSQKSICIGGYTVFNKNNPKTPLTIGRTTFWYINRVNLIVQPGIWRFVFLREAVEEIYFGNQKMGEDQFFISQLDLRKEQVQFSNSNCYTYITGDASQLTRDSGKYESLRNTVKEIAKLPAMKNNQFGIFFLLRMELTLLFGMKSRSQVKEIIEINTNIRIKLYQYPLFAYYFVFGTLSQRFSRLISNVRNSAY